MGLIEKYYVGFKLGNYFLEFLEIFSNTVVEFVRRKEDVDDVCVVRDGVRGIMPRDCLRITAQRPHNPQISGSFGSRVGGSTFSGGARSWDA